jgi:DNA-binding NarL/FixJ family response regulator
MPTRPILIVDDHALARAGFAELLHEAGLDLEVRQAGDADAALGMLRAAPVDLLIVDLSMPGRSGLELLRHVRATHPGMPVLVLSGFPERQYALNVLKAGARGYLSKSCTPAQLAEAVSSLLAGGRYLSAETAELLVGETLGGGGGPRHVQLSEREFDIFLKLAIGQGTTQVASMLYLSPKTVSTYRTRILEKLEMKTNAEMTRYALEHGLIQ